MLNSEIIPAVSNPLRLESIPPGPVGAVRLVETTLVHGQSKLTIEVPADDLVPK